MLYDLAAKINHVSDQTLFAEGRLEAAIAEISAKLEKPLEVSYMLPDTSPITQFYLKTEVSVSSLLVFHDNELSETINTFKVYAEEIASIAGGEVSRSESFYNNSKIFSRLYV